MSAAQRVLEMDELLRSILSYIHTPVVWSEDDLSFDDPPPTRGFLLSAMHVNKQWRDVGLDYLWSDINAGDLARILLYWQYYSSQSSNLKADCDDLDKVPLLVRHARRIRDLEVWLADRDVVRDALSSISTGIWEDMGKLRVLKLATDWSPKHFDASRRFLAPTLSTVCLVVELEIDQVHEQTLWWSAEHEAFFRALLRRAGPKFHEFFLRLSEPQLWPFLEDRVLTFLTEVPNLSTVYLPTPALSPPLVMRIAAKHPTIRIRSSDNHEITGDRFPQPGDLTVYDSRPRSIGDGQVMNGSPLGELDGDGSTYRWSPSELAICPDAAGLLRLVQHNLDVKMLTQLEIALSHVSTIEPLRIALSAIGQDAVALRKFRLVAPDSEFPCPPPTFGEPVLPRLEWHTLAPLMACTALEVFAVVWDTSILITDAEIDELAHAWPQLRSLRLRGGRPPPSSPLEPLPSMAVLATLSRCCPLLQVLEMQLSPVTHASTPDDFRKFEHLTHVAICVGPPCLDEAVSMAATHHFLWEIFPGRIHDANTTSRLGPYEMWRVEVFTLDDIARTMTLQYLAQWHEWLRFTDVFRCGLCDLWLERGRIA